MSLYCRPPSLEMDEPMLEESSDSENAAWLHQNLTSMQIKRSEMNALIMDYLVHEGFKEAAERFKEEANIDQTVQTQKPHFETPDMIDKRIEVRTVIQDGDILKAKTLINMYYPELFDNHRELYFKLQQQHVIELIRNQKINEVLAYVHEHLSVSDNLPRNEIERTLALLAYENPDSSPYSDLLASAHRLQLASEINEAILRETTGNVETPKPRLVTLLKLVYWTQAELERKEIQFPKMNDLFDCGSINFDKL